MIIFHNTLLCRRCRNMTKGIDGVDKKILQMLSENPEISQIDLAKRLKIS